MKIWITFLAFISIIFADGGFAYLQITDDGRIFASDYRGTGIYQIDRSRYDSGCGAGD